MVRTKADNCSRKAVAAKAPRKISTPSRSTASSDKSSAKKTGPGGNSTINRPVPEWQKPISHFFSVKTPTEKKDESDNDEEEESSSPDKENTTPNVVCDDVIEVEDTNAQSDEEETVQPTRKRRKNEFMDSDDDD